MTGHRVLRVLFDEGVPVSLAKVFHARNHDVIPFADVLLPGASDKEVVAVAVHQQACLVALDADMKSFVRRYGQPQSGGRYKRLDLLHLTCSPHLAHSRVEQTLDLIEREWIFAREKPSRRLWIDLGAHAITTYR